MLPVGPTVFVDLEADSSVVPALSVGRMLFVDSPETSLEFDLTGSAAAVRSMVQCHRDAIE